MCFFKNLYLNYEKKIENCMMNMKNVCECRPIDEKK